MSEDAPRPPVLVIVGPTAVGKTAAAVELCEALGGEIVGADSVQVFRGLDVGSNKPSLDELRGVRHHLIDILSPSEHLDAARYAALADACITAVHAQGRLPVVVGGTGLWLRALLRGLVELPQVDPALRTQLERAHEEQGGARLHARLSELDPLSAERIHPSDKLRIVRALEVYEQTGKPLGELRRQHALGAPRYPAHVVEMDLPIPEWREIVTSRTARMFEAGLVAEVRGLIAQHGPHLRALRAVGYRKVAAGLAAGQSELEMLPRVLSATLVYGRRLRNWFRTDPSITERVPAREVVTSDHLERLRARFGR
jgi:tRNA dimethylallyltransferase